MIAALKVLPIAALQGPRDLFRCEHFATVLQAQRCAQRQGAKWTVRNQTKRSGDTRTDMRFGHRTSGKCAAGHAVIGQLAGKELEPPRAVEHRSQTIARIRAQQEYAGMELAPAPALIQVQPAPPVEEKTMPEISEEKFRGAWQASFGRTNATAKALGLTWYAADQLKKKFGIRGYTPGAVPAKKKPEPKQQREAATASAKPAKQPPAAAAPPSGEHLSPEDFLRAQLEHARAKVAELKPYEAKVAKLERMLAAADAA